MADDGGQLAPGDAGWLDKRQFAERLSCSVRWIGYRLAEGMPHARIAGRVKFDPALAERWLEEHGYIDRRGDGWTT